MGWPRVRHLTPAISRWEREQGTRVRGVSEENFLLSACIKAFVMTGKRGMVLMRQILTAL
jgi:hypothetical protein